jgi:multidrug efflux pump subunit AcrA (membrane-fusion protein)
VELPSKAELNGLPRRAMIAFAGRCALRVQPLFKHGWPEAPKKYLDAIDRAVTLVQTSAVSPVSTSDLHGAYAGAARAAYAAARVDAAARAADAAAYAARAAHAARAAYARAAAYAADATAAAAAAATAATAATATAAAMRRDFELLKAAAEREQWTNDTPVPPEFFGPLWPDGEPDGWPVKEIELDPEPVELVIELDVP